MKADFHLHSSFSGDSDTASEQIVQAGLQRGLSAICFTEHYDADYPYDDVCFELDTKAYLGRIRELRSVYRGQIDIGFGVELGLQPQPGKPPAFRYFPPDQPAVVVDHVKPDRKADTA